MQTAAKKWKTSIRVDDGSMGQASGLGVTIGQWLVQRGVLPDRFARQACVSDSIAIQFLALPYILTLTLTSTLTQAVKQLLTQMQANAYFHPCDVRHPSLAGNFAPANCQQTLAQTCPALEGVDHWRSVGNGQGSGQHAVHSCSERLTPDPAEFPSLPIE